jgi:hypothetical protein
MWVSIINQWSGHLPAICRACLPSCSQDVRQMCAPPDTVIHLHMNCCPDCLNHQAQTKHITAGVGDTQSAVHLPSVYTRTRSHTHTLTPTPARTPSLLPLPTLCALRTATCLLLVLLLPPLCRSLQMLCRPWPVVFQQPATFTPLLAMPHMRHPNSRSEPRVLLMPPAACIN